jgi:nucleotidyltransferase/DNA polymerase involved in DNA repair
MTSRRSSNEFRLTRPLPNVACCTDLFGPPFEIANTIRRCVRAELGLPVSVGIARTKHVAKNAWQAAKLDGPTFLVAGSDCWSSLCSGARPAALEVVGIWN